METALIDCKTDPEWLPKVVAHFERHGFAVVSGVLPSDLITTIISGLYHAYDCILQEIGEQRLARAKELGMVRIPAKFSPIFFKFLEIPEVLAVVDNLLSDTAIMHLQNGFINPPLNTIATTDDLKQYHLHMDFPRVLNQYRASINTFFTLTESNEHNGGTRVVPGTQQMLQVPDPDWLAKRAFSVTCPAGSMIVFDSTLWHSGGPNHSDHARLTVNHQFTRSYIKQQIDYVRALGEDTILQLPARSQQLLGYYTRVVTSLDEFYQPEEKRLYRKNQG